MNEPKNTRYISLTCRQAYYHCTFWKIITRKQRNPTRKCTYHRVWSGFGDKYLSILRACCQEWQIICHMRKLQSNDKYHVHIAHWQMICRICLFVAKFDNLGNNFPFTLNVGKLVCQTLSNYVKLWFAASFVTSVNSFATVYSKYLPFDVSVNLA